MPGYANNSQQFRDLICASREKATQLEICRQPLPLLVYSYSSLGFPDLPEWYRTTRNIPPIQLLSLYDLHHHLSHQKILNSSEFTPTVRFLDSGMYEVEGLTDIESKQNQGNQLNWSKNLYVETARIFAHNGDVVVSYDDRSLSLDDQIKQGLTLFKRIKQQGIIRNLLLHPNGTSPEKVWWPTLSRHKNRVR